MDILSRRYLFLLYVISGVLLGVGFVLPLMWPLGLCGVALFFFLVNKTRKLSEVILGGFISWTVKSLFATSLFWSAYPIKWLELSLEGTQLFLIGTYWVTVSMFLGFGGIFVASLWWWLKNKFVPAYGLLIVPTLWVLAEIFSALSFSVWTTGPGSTLNTLYSLGYLGYLFGNHETLLLLASFGGVYILSFSASFIGYLGLLSYSFFSKKRAFIISATLLFILWGSSGDVSPIEMAEDTSDNAIKIAIIDTSFGDEFFAKENRDTYKSQQVAEAVETALALKPDYIILPEDSRFTSVKVTPEVAYRFFRFQSSDSESIVIDSGRAPLSGDEVILRATIYDGVSKKGWAVDKQYLVPQGEFMPYFYIVSLSVLGMKDVITNVDKKLAYRPGPLVSQSHFPEVVPGILFCFESADPYAVRRLLKERSMPFVAHPVSHAWFNQSKILWRQLDNMLKVQAVWNDINIISAGNMSRGALYNNKGEVLYPDIKAEGESWKVGIIKL